LKICVPYTRLQPATETVLRGYPVEFYPLEGDDGYVYYLKQRWDDGLTFINCEHDTIFWHGAIESLEECLGDWCAYGLKGESPANPWSPTLNLVKFTDRFISTHPTIWDALLDEDMPPQKWRLCDGWLRKYVGSEYCHRHTPPVVNDNQISANVWNILHRAECKKCSQQKQSQPL
jgi:hypothetical protein